MKLKFVTITGPDESVTPEQTVQLLTDYPYFECGILLRERRPAEALPLYPRRPWIKEFMKQKPSGSLTSLHLCSEPAAAFLDGDVTLLDDLAKDFSGFDRIQINYRKRSNDVDGRKMMRLKLLLHERGLNQELIIPVMKENETLFRTMQSVGLNTSVLFDDSAGAGLLPENWSKPLPKVVCGYAGGLSPENIAEQLVKIDAVTSEDYVTWVDMEGRIRTPDRRQFVIPKAASCLKQAAKYLMK